MVDDFGEGVLPLDLAMEIGAMSDMEYSNDSNGNVINAVWK